MDLIKHQEHWCELYVEGDDEGGGGRGGRFASVETRVVDVNSRDRAPAQLIRYQYHNNLSSACLELEEHAQTISYEEFTPHSHVGVGSQCNITRTHKP
jgi:hypothetical protein